MKRKKRFEAIMLPAVFIFFLMAGILLLPAEKAKADSEDIQTMGKYEITSNALITKCKLADMDRDYKKKTRVYKMTSTTKIQKGTNSGYITLKGKKRAQAIKRLNRTCEKIGFFLKNGKVTCIRYNLPY